MPNARLRTLKFFLLVVALLTSASVNAGLFGFGGDSWKEEVLLHDGQKIIVKRSLSYGGRHEIGQSEPIKEQTISFLLPGSNKAVTWVSEYGEDLGRTNFELLAIHILNGIPYVVAEPNLCLSYNKWGRPNPPYVFFKYDGKAWNRIPVSEFPAEFKTFNVVIGLANQTVEVLVKQGLVSVEAVRKQNDELTRFRGEPTIIREAMPNVGKHCPIDIRTKTGWEGIGFYKYQPTYEACMAYCAKQGVTSQDCPCSTLFKAN
jgi:hypothetical protein